MTDPSAGPSSPSPAEKAITEIVYATACRYEGHESQCNIYGCTRHDHPEVKAVRRLVSALVRSVEERTLKGHTGNHDRRVEPTDCCRICAGYSKRYPVCYDAKCACHEPPSVPPQRVEPPPVDPSVSDQTPKCKHGVAVYARCLNCEASGGNGIISAGRALADAAIRVGDPEPRVDSVEPPASQPEELGRETCEDCGKVQWLVWGAEQGLWIKFSGGRSILCPDCFDKRAAKQGRLLTWTPTLHSSMRAPVPASVASQEGPSEVDGDAEAEGEMQEKPVGMSVGQDGDLARKTCPTCKRNLPDNRLFATHKCVPPPSVPPQRVEPEPELLDALKASLGQRYAGMKDAPWFKEAHEGKPSGEGTRVDSVEPPASTGCGHEFDRGRCIHCGTKRPLCEKCKSEAARTPRWMAAPECTHAASQEGPSEAAQAIAEKLVAFLAFPAYANADAWRERFMRDAERLIDSALSSKGVAVRDEALERENELRLEWWSNHGCPLSARYGDDGEMQCGACRTNFKAPSDDHRALPGLSYVDLKARVYELRMVALSKAMEGRALKEGK